MNFRSGTPLDAPAIADLIARFHGELTGHPDGLGAEPYLASVSCAAEQGYLASDRYRYLLAERAGALLGFIALRDGSHVFHLFVDARHHRQGIARGLWQAARASEGAAGVRRFTVNSSLRAVPVYRAFGFHEAGAVVSSHGISFRPMTFAAPAQAGVSSPR